jgi:GGDEF domain-containing protein
MHFFRRQPKAPKPESNEGRATSPEELLLDPETKLYISWYLHQRLAEEVERAKRHGRPFSIIVCRPQALPGEETSRAVETASPHFSRLLRQGDLVGHLEDGVIAIGLPETPAAGARVLSHRLRSELSLRSAFVNKQIWQVGWASCPEDGETPEALLQSAAAATSERRRAAA